SITGCTIQHSANYPGSGEKTTAPGGANIRLAGKQSYPINSVTISGNVLSDTSVSVDVNYAHDIAINSNNFFAPKPHNLRVANSQRVVVNGNTFNPRQFVRPGTISFTKCDDCILSSSTLHRFSTSDGAVILDQCSGFLLNALSLSDCDSRIVLRETTDTTIANCRVIRMTAGGKSVSAGESNSRIRLNGNSFSTPPDVASGAVE
ncbi:MAG: hypothetical protein GY826_12175, partial [Fuerstiella sp.]|nr:hypothetical protein [Fuerstiella sp.]